MQLSINIQTTPYTKDEVDKMASDGITEISALVAVQFSDVVAHDDNWLIEELSKKLAEGTGLGQIIYKPVDICDAHIIFEVKACLLKCNKTIA